MDDLPRKGPTVDFEPILEGTVDLSRPDLEVTEPDLFRFAPAEMSRRQLRYWLQNAVGRSASTLERVLTLDIDGPVDADRFVEAWSVTVRATPALRVVVSDDPGNPLVRISPLVFEPEIVGGLDASSWEADATQRLLTPIALDRQAYEAWLYVAPDRARLVLRLHSIAADLSSFRVIVQRLARVYRGRNLGTDARFDEFLRRERAYRETPQAESDARYWAERLDVERGVPSYYGQRPTHDRLASTRWTVTHDSLEELRALAEQTYRPFGVKRTLRTLPLVTTVTVAFLARVTESRTIGLAVPIDMRDEDGVGPMTEMCPIFVDVEEDDTFESLLARVTQQLQEAAPRARNSIDNRYGKLAYDAVVEVVDLRFHDFADAPTRARIDTSPAGVAEGDARRDYASFSVQFGRHRDAEISIRFELADDAFPASVAPRVSGHFMALLAAMSERLDAPIFEVPLEARPEPVPRVDVIRLDTTPCAPDAILQNARFQADAIALVTSDGEITYGALIERALRLAARLRVLGVGPETRVAVCAHRDASLIVAMLATHLAGGAFVPLDPSHPRRRTAMILEDARPLVLLTRLDLAAALDPTVTTRVVNLEEDIEPFVAFEPEPIRPESLAYVIYTSGSTGRPKGVAIEHGAFAHLLRCMASLLPITADDRWLALTTPTFDIAMLELFGPLFVGGTVVLADGASTAEPPRLVEWMTRHAPTIVQATPSTWRAIVDSGWGGDPSIALLSGGEPLPTDLAVALLTRGAALWNVYGPTETTIWSTARRVTEEDVNGAVPVGAPLGATELFVVGAGGVIEPDGVAGELWIGGPGLAREYLGRAELTAGAFVAHPFDPTRRVYRTGDVVRRRADGAYLCLGRRDAQVKIRGHRIELEEIEVALRECHFVRDAAVVVEVVEGDARLVAFVVPTGDATPAASALRAALERVLPGSMVPSRFVAVSSLLYTPNGKIDRRGLVSSSATVAQGPSRAAIRARDDLELQIVAVWRQVLGTGDISVDDVFFDLGGHSLHAVSMLSILRERLGAPVPVAEFFRRPTVAALAELVGTRAARRHASLIELSPGGDQTPLFCVCGLQLYQDLALAIGGDRPVYGVLSPAEIDFLAMDDPSELPNVPSLAAEYVDAIVRERPDGPYAIAGVSFGGLLAYETARQLRARGAEVTSVIILDATLDSAIRGGARRWVANRVRGLLRRGRRAVHREADAISALDALRSYAYDEQALDYERSLPAYEGDVVVVRARDRHIGYDVDPDLGWTRHVTGTTDVYEVPGTHLGILAEPNATVLARAIVPHLDPRVR